MTFPFSPVRASKPSTNFTLNDEQLQRLDAADASAPGFPYYFVTQEGVRPVIYGNTLSVIDNHR